MRYVHQFSLNFNQNFNDFGAFDELIAIFEQMDDEELIQKLERKRRNGRNEWPVIAMWRGLIAKTYYKHRSTSDFIKELDRNPRLTEICGFKPRKINGVTRRAPSTAAYTRFMKNLQKEGCCLEEEFEKSTERCYEELPGFGKGLMADGKAIQSYAHKNTSKTGHVDGRSETDGEVCTKKYYGMVNNVRQIVAIKKWFGFRAHIIAEAHYELPIYVDVLKAAESEQKELRHQLQEIKKKHPEWLEQAEYLLADKGYDSLETIEQLESYGVHPIIDIRCMRKDGEKTKQYRDTNLAYDYKGRVVYYPENPKEKEIDLRFMGYDPLNNAHRYGYTHNGKTKVFRIKCSENPRIFTRIARTSLKWKRLYAKRSGIERINGRLDRDYGFENHYIRGLKKMKMYVLLSCMVMQAKALAKYRLSQRELYPPTAMAA